MIGKIGPYTVFVTPPSTPTPTEQPVFESPKKVVASPPAAPPPVLPPPQQFDKSYVSDSDGSILGFFKNAASKVQNAHSSLDDHLARWFGLNQSKYQWALDDYYESKGLAVEGLQQALQRQDGEPMAVPDGVCNREVGDLVEKEDLEDVDCCIDDFDYQNLFHETGIADQAIGGGLEMDLWIAKELEPVYYDSMTRRKILISFLVKENNLILFFACEGEQSDFLLDEGFVCEGEDSEFVIDGKRLENDVSKLDVMDSVWMDDHDKNQKKPNKKYFCQKNSNYTLHKLVAKKIVKAGGFLGSNAKEKQNSVDPYIYRNIAARYIWVGKMVEGMNLFDDKGWDLVYFWRIYKEKEGVKVKEISSKMQSEDETSNDILVHPQNKLTVVDEKQVKQQKKEGTSASASGVETAAIIATVVIIVVKVFILVYVCKKRARAQSSNVFPADSEFLTLTMDEFLNDMEREKPIRFTSQQLRIATDNFTNLLVSGGFGAVYKGLNTQISPLTIHFGTNWPLNF
ncbi:Concanavalin A-like lectin/glucanase, subgroup [Corchorus capsularis]|uniref:Concanavalin A-like lectin/glucanase, subgroup n=1 Tax=Corchorus capsularis TaxID=210143 RepID=A0A1R3JY97_COCAP|nr:Concanavalin A-like lectin/glucanase, subgroup [Corchorus capsularis]